MSKKKQIKAYQELEAALEVFKVAINTAEAAGLEVSCDSQLIDHLDEMMYEVAEAADIVM